MVHKIKGILPIILIISVLLSGCAKAEENDTVTDDEIWSMTGYYLWTGYCDMIITEESFTVQHGNQAPYIETLYNPTEIYFREGDEGDVPFDSLKSGDKIEVDVKYIAASYPGQARIYGLRLVEAGDVSNINNETLLDLESMGYHAVIGEKTEQPNVTRSSGYFVRTETDCFLVPSEKYGTLADIDLLKIYPAKEMGAPPNFDMSGVSLDSFNTGDRIWVDIMIVQELYPPISPICGAALIEKGDISNIDSETLSKLSELGYTVSEAE